MNEIRDELKKLELWAKELKEDMDKNAKLRLIHADLIMIKEFATRAENKLKEVITG